MPGNTQANRGDVLLMVGTRKGAFFLTADAVPGRAGRSQGRTTLAATCSTLPINSVDAGLIA